MSADSIKLAPRILPGIKRAQAICGGCGSPKVAVPDRDGRINKCCWICGSARMGWLVLQDGAA